MRKLGRSTTDGMPDAVRWASISPCQCQNATGEPISAPRAESLTSRRTPAAAARSITVHSWSTWPTTFPQAR